MERYMQCYECGRNHMPSDSIVVLAIDLKRDLYWLVTCSYDCLFDYLANRRDNYLILRLITPHLEIPAWDNSWWREDYE